MWQLQYQLIELKRIRMQREFRRNIEVEWHIVPLGQFDLLPSQVANVGLRATRWRIEMQLKREILSYHRERHAAIIQRRTAITDLKVSDTQAEKSIAPGAFACRYSRCWQITFAILVKSHGKLRLIQKQFIDRNFLAEERKHMNCDVDARRMKKRRCSCSLQSVERKTVKLSSQRQHAEM